MKCDIRTKATGFTKRHRIYLNGEAVAEFWFFREVNRKFGPLTSGNFWFLDNPEKKMDIGCYGYFKDAKEFCEYLVASRYCN